MPPLSRRARQLALARCIPKFAGFFLERDLGANRKRDSFKYALRELQSLRRLQTAIADEQDRLSSGAASTDSQNENLPAKSSDSWTAGDQTAIGQKAVEQAPVKQTSEEDQ